MCAKVEGVSLPRIYFTQRKTGNNNNNKTNANFVRKLIRTIVYFIAVQMAKRVPNECRMNENAQSVDVLEFYGCILRVQHLREIRLHLCSAHINLFTRHENRSHAYQLHRQTLRLCTLHTHTHTQAETEARTQYEHQNRQIIMRDSSHEITKPLVVIRFWGPPLTLQQLDIICNAAQNAVS